MSLDKQGNYIDKFGRHYKKFYVPIKNLVKAD